MNDFITEHKLFTSIALLLTALIIRWLIIHYLMKRPDDGEFQIKRWINRIKNITNLFIFIGLIMIWLFELRYLALSIAAFAVALVIATREYIQSILASFYQSSAKLFTIGDWIKVGNHCGEVVRNDWLSTTLLEVDLDSNSYTYTGKTLVLPNYTFATAVVTNLNFMRRYVNHTFSITREPLPVNLFDFKQPLLDKAIEYCENFGVVAERYNTLIEKRLGVTIGDAKPSVRITTTNLGKTQFDITVFCPTEEAVAIEQRLIEDFMTLWFQAVKEYEQAQAVS